MEKRRTYKAIEMAIEQARWDLRSLLGVKSKAVIRKKDPFEKVMKLAIKQARKELGILRGIKKEKRRDE